MVLRGWSQLGRCCERVGEDILIMKGSGLALFRIISSRMTRICPWHLMAWLFLRGQLPRTQR
jgi:hypothetical protein